jgi:hypothetical protein
MIEDVARIATALPEVTEGDRQGMRTWFVAGKAFAWERPFRKADIARFGDEPPPAGRILAVRVATLDEKDALLAVDRPGFFTIPHFDGYAAVLVQLDTVRLPALREALREAWLAVAPRKLAAVSSSGGTRSARRDGRRGRGGSSESPRPR